jgi:5-formyltetrahydrofolate cyclo-ligase
MDDELNLERRALLQWRKAERARLIEARLAVSADERKAHAERITETVAARLGDVSGKVVSLYWPFRGEPDLRPWMADLTQNGATAALPIAIALGQPLVFRTYRPGDRLERGVWNIPVPVDGAVVMPDIVIAPVVGFDAGNYRLGYGGGFFDRTLAAMPKTPVKIGVGYELQRIESIRPQPYDIPMDFVVTERGIAFPDAVL